MKTNEDKIAALKERIEYYRSARETAKWQDDQLNYELYTNKINNAENRISYLENLNRMFL